jgi:hypothetical protein
MADQEAPEVKETGEDKLARLQRSPCLEVRGGHLLLL